MTSKTTTMKTGSSSPTQRTSKQLVEPSKKEAVAHIPVPDVGTWSGAKAVTPGNDTLHQTSVHQGVSSARGRRPAPARTVVGRRSSSVGQSSVKKMVATPKDKSPPASKSDLARAVFEQMHRQGRSRKEVIEAFVSDIKLTPSGASTYYQKFLTESKTPAGRAARQAGTSTASRRGRPTDESSKAGLARAIFKRMAKASRKEVLDAFIHEAGLTPAGASTYYQTQRHAA